MDRISPHAGATNTQTYSCHNHAVCAVQFVQLPEEKATVALEPLPLIDYQALKGVSSDDSKNSKVSYLPSGLLLEDCMPVVRARNAFIRCYQYVKFGLCVTFRSLVMEQFKLLDDIPRFFLSIEGDDPQLWSPAFEFSDPIGNRRVGNHN